MLDDRPEISLITPTNNSMDVDDDSVLIDSKGGSGSTSAAGPSSSLFPALANQSEPTSALKNEFRRVPIPPHRMTPLKREWVNLYGPMVENLGLQVRMNVKRRCVEMKVSLAAVCLGVVGKLIQRTRHQPIHPTAVPCKKGPIS